MLSTPKHKVIATCINGLERDGYGVSETTDYEAAIATLKPFGKTLTPMMSPALNDFTQGNCSWILLTFNGDVIGGIAARIDDLKDETLGSYWRRHAKRLYGAGTNNQIVRVSRFIDTEVKGRVLYFGDLVLDRAHRGVGSHLRYFTAYCQMGVSAAVDPDWQYSFIPQVHAQAGMAFNHFFSKSIPGAQEWKNPPEGRKNSETCVISSRVDLADMAAYFARFPHELRVVKNEGSA